MKRDDAINQLRAARKTLQDQLQGLTEAELEKPKAIGPWSIKDLLAHMAAWDEETLRIIQAFSFQAEPQYSYTISDRNDFAVWNQEQIEQRRSLTLAQVLSEFEAARRDLIQAVEGVTDQVLARGKMTPWNKPKTGIELLQDEAEHDLEHARELMSYRKKRERWARAREKYVAKRRASKKSVP